MALFIDGSCIKHLILYGFNYKEQIINNPEVFAHGFLDFVLQMMKKFNACVNNKVYIGVDRKGKFVDSDENTTTNYWRQKYYIDNKNIMLNNDNKFEYYKCNRTVKDDEIDWETINKLYDNILQTLGKYSDIVIIEVPYFEADDLGAIVSQYCKDVENMLVTNDHDLLQLINDNTKIYNPFKREVITNKMTEEELLLFYLCGCSGDAVPPVLSKTKEKKWIKKLAEKDLETIFAESSEPLKERFEVNKKIMNLSIDNLPKKLVKKVTDIIDENTFNYNELYLMKDLKKYKLHRFVEDGTKSILDRYKEFKLSRNDLTKNNKKFDMKERKKEKIESLFDSN